MKRKKINSYTPKLATKAFILVIGLMIALIHIGIFRFTPSLETIPVPMVFILLAVDAFFLWWGIVFSTQSRVTIYDEGIELEQGASKVFTTWDNVSHLGIKGWGRNQKRGIFLHEAVKPEAKGFLERLLFGWQSNFIPIGRYVHLPRTWNFFSREINKDKLLETDFGKDLYEYAPHLFDKEKPKNRLNDGYEDDAEWMEIEEESENYKYNSQ